jgi:hypothetical protein
LHRALADFPELDGLVVGGEEKVGALQTTGVNARDFEATCTIL